MIWSVLVDSNRQTGSVANGPAHMRQPEIMNLAGSGNGGSMRQHPELNGCSGMQC